MIYGFSRVKANHCFESKIRLFPYLKRNGHTFAFKILYRLSVGVKENLLPYYTRRWRHKIQNDILRNVTFG